jgi:hypothetical protein
MNPDDIIRSLAERSALAVAGIIYQIREKEILVVAVANLHRKPDYWKDRI